MGDPDFLCNFIPYIGSVIAYTLPVGFAFLMYGIRWEPITAAVLLSSVRSGRRRSRADDHRQGGGLEPACHPRVAGILGPVVGHPGMFLAVRHGRRDDRPDHFESTRSVAKLFRGG